MTGLIAVLPVLDAGKGKRCIDSITQEKGACGIDPKDILLVDNTRNQDMRKYKGMFQYYRDPNNHNLGVARSWNIGARKVLEEKLDYLVIMSASLQFGPELHCTWLWQMKQFWGETVIESEGHSWHLIALHRRVFEKIGLFDENFYPAYVEQIDFGYRMRVQQLEHHFRHVWCNVLSHGAGSHIQYVDCPATPLLDYYADKWGGPKGEETFVQPWGSQPIGYFPDSSISELAAKYNLSEWW